MSGEAVQRGGSLKVNRKKVGDKKNQKTVRTAGRHLQINVMEINIHTENDIRINSTKIKVQFCDVGQETANREKLTSGKINTINTTSDRVKKKTQLGSKFDG